MPVLLCLALLFSQAFGFKHGFDHAKLNSHLDRVEQTVDQSANDYFKDLSPKKNQAHSCVALDGICFAFFALSNQLGFFLLSDLTEARHFQIADTAGKKQYFSYLSRAPPSLS
jgi:hypothetical protein